MANKNVDKVPLGVIQKAETSTTDMIEIVKEMHKYVPRVREDITVECEGEIMKTYEVNVHPILFGGDQLTVARARGAACVKTNELDAKKRLEGLVPVWEDWHTKMTLLTVSSNSSIIKNYTVK